MKCAIFALVAAVFWLAVSTFGSVAFGEWLRLGLGWSGEGSGMAGIVIWFCLTIVAPALAFAVYLSEKNKVRR